MMSLDSLSTLGSELTTEQMGSVDGGIIPALIVLNMVIWGANGVVYVVKNT